MAKGSFGIPAIAIVLIGLIFFAPTLLKFFFSNPIALGFIILTFFFMAFKRR